MTKLKQNKVLNLLLIFVCLCGSIIVCLSTLILILSYLYLQTKG